MELWDFLTVPDESLNTDKLGAVAKGPANPDIPSIKSCHPEVDGGWLSKAVKIGRSGCSRDAQLGGWPVTEEINNCCQSSVQSPQSGRFWVFQDRTAVRPKDPYFEVFLHQPTETDCIPITCCREENFLGRYKKNRSRKTTLLKKARVDNCKTYLEFRSLAVRQQKPICNYPKNNISITSIIHKL